jgi:hypothetical protein
MKYCQLLKCLLTYCSTKCSHLYMVAVVHKLNTNHEAILNFVLVLFVCMMEQQTLHLLCLAMDTQNFRITDNGLQKIIYIS